MLLEPVNTAKARQLLNQSMALVLAGGRGSRLKQLTDNRAKPAVHFGGKFRIIDFVLSNCINSGIRRVGVVTQYKSHSLLRHLQSGWSFLRYQMNEFIDLLPAQQRVDEVHWYRGTADAIYQNVDIIRDYGPKYIVVLAGDHIYKMDYAAMLLDHNRHPCRASQRAENLQILHPHIEFAALGMPKRQELWDTGSSRLLDLLLVRVEAIGCFHVDRRKHQDGSHP